MSSFTILGSAGPLQVGHAPGKVWVAGAFLSPDDADRLGDLVRKATAAARAEEPDSEHPANPGLFL
jgi:hypothetical protein